MFQDPYKPTSIAHIGYFLYLCGKLFDAMNIPIKPMNKCCPRCGKAFVCTHNALCQCVGISLSVRARTYMQMHYPDQCLCRQCLQDISERFAD